MTLVNNDSRLLFVSTSKKISHHYQTHQYKSIHCFSFIRINLYVLDFLNVGKQICLCSGIYLMTISLSILDEMVYIKRLIHIFQVQVTMKIAGSAILTSLISWFLSGNYKIHEIRQNLYVQGSLLDQIGFFLLLTVLIKWNESAQIQQLNMEVTLLEVFCQISSTWTVYKKFIHCPNLALCL